MSIFKIEELNHSKKQNVTKRTKTQITSGYYHLFESLFHVLPWIFVIADALITTLAFPHHTIVNDVVDVFILVGIELVVLYIYSICLEVYGMRNIITALNSPELTHKTKYNDNSISNLKKRHEFRTQVYVDRHKIHEFSSDSEKLVESEEFKPLWGELVITTNSVYEILTLKKVYLNLKIRLDDGYYVWSSNSFVSADKHRIRFLVKRGNKQTYTTTYDGTVVLNAEDFRIKYVLDSEVGKLKSGTIHIASKEDTINKEKK